MTRRKLVCIVLTLVMIITTSYSVFAAIPSFDAKKPYFEIESKTVEFGTLIAPKSYFGDKKSTDLKFGVDFGKTSNYVDVKYESTKYFTDSRFSGFVGSIINIKDDHACWNFVGRGYARITINGIEKIVYANGKDSLPERSIAFIAHKLRYDEDVYENFNNAQKTIIDFYNEFYKKETEDPYEEDMFI